VSQLIYSTEALLVFLREDQIEEPYIFLAGLLIVGLTRRARQCGIVHYQNHCTRDFIKGEVCHSSTAGYKANHATCLSTADLRRSPSSPEHVAIFSPQHASLEKQHSTSN
jgi:hypothetical protein